MGLKWHFFNRFSQRKMTLQAKSQMFPLQVLSRSQSGSVKEKQMVLERKEPPCRIWVVHMVNMKKMMVIFGTFHTINFEHFFRVVEFSVTICFPAERKQKVEPTWSIDPALAMSMYDSEWRGDEVHSYCIVTNRCCIIALKIAFQ